MTAINVSKCASLALSELLIVAQNCIMFTTIKHELVYTSELKQQILQDAIVLSNIPKRQKLAELTRRLNVTMTAKIFIKPNSSYTKLFGSPTTKIMYAVFWIFPYKQFNRTVEPPKLNQ